MPRWQRGRVGCWPGGRRTACFGRRGPWRHLQTLGLADDWVAADQADFVRRAAARMQDRASLAALRARMAAGPLCDAGRFADQLLAVVKA